MGVEVEMHLRAALQSATLGSKWIMGPPAHDGDHGVDGLHPRRRERAGRRRALVMTFIRRLCRMVAVRASAQQPRDQQNQARGCKTAHDPSFPGEHESEEHTSELQSRFDLVCRLLLEKKKVSTSGPI